MLSAFFALAARSPSRQIAFRRVVATHLVLLASVFGIMGVLGRGGPAEVLGHALLVAGIVEGAVLIGWRLTQLPRSQALEFLLVSAQRPRGLFVAEALVGLAQLTLVTLSGLPVLALLVLDGFLEPLDPLPLIVIPLAWGAVAGFGLTVWAYEPAWVRRLGEKVAMALIVFYLVVGVLAGEHLRDWLGILPDAIANVLMRCFFRFHTDNPFGVMRYWLNGPPSVATGAAIQVTLFGGGLALLFLVRGAFRLQPHFHEFHYLPLSDLRDPKRPLVGERPLTWWAVKRVARFAGRVNLWLAGGFGLLYAAYLVAGDAWPAWLGQTVFVMCDQAGGVPALTTGLVLLGAVPAAFQYGLWDSSVQDRCRRLELLLLTDLEPSDYWHAAVSAAWNRGRGYFVIAGMLWIAGLLAGRLDIGQVLAAAAGGVLLWSLYFTLGFRAFSRGMQANVLGLLLTVGLPLLVFGADRCGVPAWGAVLPPGIVYGSAAAPVGAAAAVGALCAASLALAMARRSLRCGDAELRRWYDRHAGAGAVR
jgi:hypothetical protein